MKLRFFWNGIKVGTGKLQRCFYSLGALLHHPPGTITIYGKRYRPFSEEVHRAFVVEDNTEYVSDYFDNEHMRVTPDHPLYGQVKAAWQAREAHYAKRFPVEVAS